MSRRERWCEVCGGEVCKCVRGTGGPNDPNKRVVNVPIPYADELSLAVGSKGAVLFVPTDTGGGWCVAYHVYQTPSDTDWNWFPANP